ncbi:MAG: HEAT repeat domain-containing protein [Candidatus Omnitrophota bacterium]|jgi:HEAT repeat protein
MNKEKVKKYIEDLEKENRLNIETLGYFFAKWILLTKGKDKETFTELLEGLKHEDQIVVSHVADILGKIGNARAIPYLKEICKRKDLWGVTACSLGVALVRLGDRAGIDFLMEKITSPEEHRDVRMDAAKALIRLKIRDVFEKDGKVNFDGKTMTPEWSKKLESLVSKLRAK